VNGKRSTFYPALTLPLITPGPSSPRSSACITPTIRFTRSRRSRTRQIACRFPPQLTSPVPAFPNSISRSLPIFSVDSGLIYERETHALGQAVVQTLRTAHLLRIYIPFREPKPNSAVRHCDRGLQLRPDLFRKHVFRRRPASTTRARSPRGGYVAHASAFDRAGGPARHVRSALLFSRTSGSRSLQATRRALTTHRTGSPRRTLCPVEGRSMRDVTAAVTWRASLMRSPPEKHVFRKDLGVVEVRDRSCRTAEFGFGRERGCIRSRCAVSSVCTTACPRAWVSLSSISPAVDAENRQRATDRIRECRDC